MQKELAYNTYMYLGMAHRPWKHENIAPLAKTPVMHILNSVHIKHPALILFYT